MISRYSFLLFFSVIQAPLWVIAGEYDDRLKPLEFDIEVEARKELAETFTPEVFAKTLKHFVTLFPPRYTSKQIKLKIEDRVQSLVNKTYPDTRYEEIEQEAEKKYTMYKINNQISIQRRYGNQELIVKGLLEIISDNAVKISGMLVPSVDIAREDKARFYWREHEEAISQYTRREEKMFEEKRASFIQQETKRIGETLWKESGYRRSKKTGRWIPLMKAFLYQYDKTKKNKLALLLENIREKVYIENGFVYVEETKEWVPEETLSEQVSGEGMSFLDTFKTFFKEKLGLFEEEKTDFTNDSHKEEIETNLEEEGSTSMGKNQEKSSTEQKKKEHNIKKQKKSPKKDVSDLFDENY